MNKKTSPISANTVYHLRQLPGFLDPLCLRQQDRYENGEERWQALGTIDGTAVLLVAHTQTDIDGGEVIRIISARRATKSERRQYEQG